MLKNIRINQIYVKADGNCFYRCLSMYFHRNQNYHIKMREEICKFGKENNDIFPKSIHPVENINEFLEYHSKNGIWADSF